MVLLCSVFFSYYGHILLDKVALVQRIKIVLEKNFMVFN